MTNFRTKTVALNVVASISLLASGGTIAQAQTQAQGDMSTSVSMMLYHLNTNKNGQQFYLDRNGQSYQLPGAGCNDPKTLAVYTGSNGQRWYVDKTGQAIDLPPITPASYSGNATYNQSGVSQNGFSMDGQNYSADGTPQNVTINNDPQYNANSGSSDDSDAYDSGVAAGVGAAVGALAGDALADSIDGIPYNTALYVGVGGYPYYWGADGLRYPLATTFAGRNWWNGWRNNWNWYHTNVFNNYGRYYGQARVAQPYFNHPNDMVPGALSDQLTNDRNLANRNLANFDDHGNQPIHGPMDSRGYDSGVERSGDVMRGFASDLNGNGFGNRFGGFRGGGSGFGGGFGGFHGGGGRR